jgi:hypothetical protein
MRIAVAVVFQNVTAVTTRPSDSGVATGERKRVSGRILMRRREIEKRGRALWQLVRY